jgi:ribose transport system substrate-binding protein
MKNIVIGILVLAVIGLLAALLMSPTKTLDQISATTQPTRQYRIGISIPAADHGWTAGVAWWAQRAMALHPEITWQFAAADTPEKQIADIQDMMAKGIDGLVILATESAPLTPIAQEAHQRGVYIVNVDRGFLQPAADVFLEGDNKSFGKKSADFIATKLRGKGNLVILEGIPSTVNTDRVNSALAVFANYPDIKILARQPAMWNREKALTVMQNYLTQFPHIDAVWAGDDDTALGAMQAIREAARQNEMWVVGGGGMKDIVKMISDNDPLIPATITYPPSMIAEGIQLAAGALRDGNQQKISQFVPRHMLIDVDLVTPDNAKQYYFPDSAY